MSHGYNVKKNTPDPLINLVETAAQDFYIATTKVWLVDMFPWRAFSSPAEALVPLSHVLFQCVTCLSGSRFTVLQQSIARLTSIKWRFLTNL
ncbi:hypothetical protein PHLCEN_2v5746 [Hermanssonia centrifuga]|uniref:Uncharacterized protein n=1 Tax=Hermanssonia centrifuga TaxID=98765 RepID=A0A2R6P239_9APHY|nr:hypothetical protein PHLCEN_2v5746 [Hermanssonia centrifuga]